MFHISDFKYALRLLRKSPRFTLLTVLVMAGGLAISIYTYTVLNTMLYKDLPFADGGSIVRILGKKERRNVALNAFELSQMRLDLQSLTGVGAYRTGRALLSDVDYTRSFKTTYAEWNIFEFTQTQPLMGRGFVRQDNVEGGQVVVIGYKVWKSVFSAAPDVLDRVVRINGKPTRIIGVMPQGYSFPISAEIWLPLSARELSPTGYSDTALDAFARLRSGYSQAEAGTELSEALRLAQLQLKGPDVEENKLDRALVLSFQAAQTGREGPFIFAILNAVSLFIVLLACVNVGNMLLARTNERLREIAVRVALGAPRLRLMIQMMLESVFICVIGGLLAVAISSWALPATNRFLSSAFEGDLPYWWNWRLDGQAIAATGLFVLLAILLVSALPNYRAASIHPGSLLRDGTQGAQGRTTGRIARFLVTVEIVLISVIMLIGSAMAIVAYRFAHVDFGMDSDRLMRMPIELSGDAYDTPEEQVLFYDRLLAELRRSGQVDAAVFMQELGETRFAVDEVEYNTATDYPTAALLVASDTPKPVGTRLLEGRNFDFRDNATGLRTTVVSESLAKTHWPDGSALGRRIRVFTTPTQQETRIVIGVVSDVRRGDLFESSRNSFAALYIPLQQSVLPGGAVLVKYQGTEEAARNEMYRAVAAIDAYMAPSRIMSYRAVLAQLTLMATTMTDLFVRCGLFALLLAMTGIYGLSSNMVVQRMHEIGLRRAVGASDGTIIALFLKQSGRQLAIGLSISGLICIAILFVLLKFAGIGVALLIGMGLMVAVLVAALVLAAIYLSIRRAVRYEPAVALRYE
jgi:predicted permease